MLDSLTESSPALTIEAHRLDDLAPSDIRAMERLFVASPSAHTFQLPEYTRFCSAPGRAPLVLMAREGDALAGYWLLHFEQYRRLGINMFTAMARSGPVLGPGRQLHPETALASFARAAIAAVFRRRTKKLVVTSEIGYGAPMANVLPALDFDRQEVETFVVDLTRPLDEIERRVAKAAVRQIRAAQREGMRVEVAASTREADEYRPVLCDVLARGGLNVMPPSDFGERWSRLNQARPSPLLYARDADGAVAGGVLFFGAGDLALNFHTAVRRGTPRLGDLLTWRQIVMAKEMGFSRFDLLSVAVDPEPGSPEAGRRDFKAKWGGELHSTPVFTYRPRPSLAYRAARTLLRRR